MAVTKPNRLIVFDCDGTLVDSQHNIVEAMTRAFRRHDLHDPVPEEVRRTVGLSILESVGRLLPDTPYDTLESVGEAYRTASYELRLEPNHEEPLFPGIGEMIRSLSGTDAILAVATGKSQRGLRKTLQNHDLQQHFTILKTSDDGPGKPDPTILLDAIAEAGADAASTVMIGDTVFDIAMARSANAHAVGVNWGYHEPDELDAAGAHVILDEIKELSNFLETLWGEN
jgi:phosphoglycolate phosphatase